ncbi:hypothetical protein ACOME3_008999 [Neoechinorhynchus agilis]
MPDLQTLVKETAKIGIELNAAKCEILVMNVEDEANGQNIVKDFPNLAPWIELMPLDRLSLLGSCIFCSNVELFGTCRCSELIVQRRLCRHDKVSKCEAYHILRSTERLEIADEEGRGNDGWIALNRINCLSMEPQLLERERKNA